MRYLYFCVCACVCFCACAHACVFYVWHMEFVMYIVFVVCFVFGEDIPIIPSRKDREKDRWTSTGHGRVTSRGRSIERRESTGEFWSLGTWGAPM